MKINFKRAFTLAEVLITLGIIGVVAAMTIPGLLTNIQNAHHRVAYKKAFSTLNQALRFTEEEGEISLDLSTSTVSNGSGHFTSQVGEIFKHMATHFYNAPTLCMNNNPDMCWECDNGEAGYISGSGAPDWLGCDKSSYAFIDASGIAYYLYYNNEYPILIDVNGKRKPNQLGRDRFVLKFANSLEPSNNYPSYIDSVQPLDDKINKNRWCPQGECYYKTWIQGEKK